MILVYKGMNEEILRKGNRIIGKIITTINTEKSPNIEIEINEVRNLIVIE